MQHVYPELTEDMRRMMSDGLNYFISKGMLSVSEERFLSSIARLLHDYQIEVKVEVSD